MASHKICSIVGGNQKDLEQSFLSSTNKQRNYGFITLMLSKNSVEQRAYSNPYRMRKDRYSKRERESVWLFVFLFYYLEKQRISTSLIFRMSARIYIFGESARTIQWIQFIYFFASILWNKERN